MSHSLQSTDLLGATVLEAQFPVPNGRPEVVVAPERAETLEWIDDRLTPEHDQ